MGNFKDLFSVQSSDYARYRPTYPPELFEYLKTLVKKRDRVWDAGTGNGQAAIELAGIFHEVIATDPSEKQIKSATKSSNISYMIEAAEKPSFNVKVDLITVAQAFHWFNHDSFADACKKVAAPECHLVVWSYAIAFMNPEIDAAVEKLYTGILGPYWERERRHVENGYRDIIMPFEEISPPHIEMKINWSCEQFIGYLKTWSALQTYLKSHSVDEVMKSFAEIESVWGKVPERTVSWPLNIRVWKIRNNGK